VPVECLTLARVSQGDGIVPGWSSLTSFDSYYGTGIGAASTSTGISEQPFSGSSLHPNHQAPFSFPANPNAFQYYHPTYAHADRRSMLDNQTAPFLSAPTSKTDPGIFLPPAIDESLIAEIRNGRKS
jgi:hypothetical protein